MRSYIVIFEDKLDLLEHSTFCKNTDELSTLIAHHNKEDYAIKRIEVLEEFDKNFKTFCKKTPALETGKTN